jgi:hypothetical protein
VCPKKEKPMPDSTLSAGQKLLGLALVGLPVHADRHDAQHLDDLLDRFRATPEIVLWSVSQELEEQRASGQLRRQPRYAELQSMVEAAYKTHIDLGVVIAERWIRRAQAREAGTSSS